MTFIVDPTSVSQSQIKADLEAFLASRPDAAKWTDFFASSAGQTIVELAAGVSAFLTYNNIVGRRETYLQYVANRTSGIGISQSLGYSVFKGRNQRLTLTVIPNTTTLLTKFTIIGSVKDLDLVLLEDTSIQSGIQTTLEAVIGNLDTEEITVATDTLASFRYQKFPVSEDFRILLNGTEVTVSNRILDLDNDQFAALTNVYDSLDVSYLNRSTAPVQYTTGDILRLEFVSLKELSFSDFDVNFNFGTLDSFIRSTSFEPAETISEIKINAPLFHETQTLIRGREDFLKTFRFLDTSLVDTNQQDVTPAVIELTYVKDDGSILTAAEKSNITNEIFANILMGIPPPEIVDPVRVPLKIDVSVVLKATGDVTSAVETVMAALEKKLEQSIDFEDTENSIEASEFVKIARLSIGSDTWTADTKYERGVHVAPTTANGFIYELERIAYFSDTEEPIFPTTVGDQVIDNDIIWECKLFDLCDTSITTWAATTEYPKRSLVVPTIPTGFMYEAVNFVNRSNGINEVQLIEFSTVPDSGTWRIHFSTEKTTDLPFNANNIDVQNAMNALTSLSEVVVTGDYTSGFTLTFQGDDGNKEQPQVDITDSGTDEIQLISFSEVPNAGDFGLDFNGQITAAIPFNAVANDVKAALEALPNIDLVVVTGDFTSGFSVTFQGINEKQDVNLLDVALLASSGADEIQRITFSAVPSSGTWRIHFGSEHTNDLAFNASNSAIQSELNGLSSLSGVVVTGSYAAGLDIEFAGADGKIDQPLMDVTNAGQNAIHNIQFSIVPDFGTWRIEYGAEETTNLAFNATPATIEAALEALPSLTDVTVTGDYGTGFDIEFTGVDGLQGHTLLTVADAGNNETQIIDFDQVPVVGDFSIEFDGQTTALIPYTADANAVKDALELLSNIDDVAVSGDFATGFQIIFQGINELQNVAEVTIPSNTLLYDSVAEETRIIVTASAGLLDGTTFLLEDENGSVAFWFDVDNSGTPIPAAALAADRAVEVTTLLAADGTSVVANKIAAAIDADSEFSATFIGTQIDIVDANPGLRTDATDVDTTFTITTQVQGAQTAVVVSPSTLIEGKIPANSLTRVGVALTVSTSETQEGLLPAQSLFDGATPVTQSVAEVLQGAPELTNLERSGNPVITTITESTKGEVPANNVLTGAAAIIISVSTLVDASSVEPVWPTEAGQVIQDGDILWLAQKLTGSPATWQPFTNYNQGDLVAPSTPVVDGDGDNLMFLTMSFLGTSASIEPTFPTVIDTSVLDNNIYWIARLASNNPNPLAWNEYYEITQTLTVE